MASSLNRQSINALISRARLQPSSQLELVDDRESGLRLRAGERGAVWSILVRLRSGKRTRITLGPYPGLGIADARRLAQDKKRDIADGVDPNAKRRADVQEAAHVAASQRTLRDVLNQYEALKLTQLRAGGNVRRALDGQRGLLRAFINRDIAAITRGDVVNAVRTHATKAPMAANRGLAYIKAFMNWCVDQEILDANPAATVKKPSRERTRDRYHSMAELIEIWNAMGKLGYPFGPLYRLLVALPMRREEVAAISETEFDLADSDPDDAVWTLPAARTKRGNALRVPLSPLARSLIVEAMASPDRAEGTPFVFSMTGDTSVSGYAKAKRRLDRVIWELRLERADKAGVDAVPMEHWTIHDLRTTFSTQACEVLEADISVVDRILNHVATATTSKIMRVYNKSEMFEPRKRVLREWGALIEREVAASLPAATDCNVTQSVIYAA